MTRILPGLFAMLLSLSLGGQYIQVEHLNTEQGLPTEEINGLLATADHYLWLATNHGLYRHDGYQYQPIAFPPPPSGPPSSQAYRIEPMGTEQFYLLFLNHGFGIYNFRSAQFEYFSHEPGDPTSLPSNFVQSISMTAHRHGFLSTGVDSGVLIKQAAPSNNTCRRFYCLL